MIDNETRDTIVRLASSRIVALEKGLKTEVGSITADLADRGFSLSSMRVTSIKATGKRNLAQRAELIRNTIIEVANRNIGPAPNLRTICRFCLMKSINRNSPTFVITWNALFPTKLRSSVHSARYGRKLRCIVMK